MSDCGFPWHDGKDIGWAFVQPTARHCALATLLESGLLGNISTARLHFVPPHMVPPGSPFFATHRGEHNVCKQRLPLGDAGPSYSQSSSNSLWPGKVMLTWRTIDPGCECIDPGCECAWLRRVGEAHGLLRGLLKRLVDTLSCMLAVRPPDLKLSAVAAAAAAMPSPPGRPDANDDERDADAPPVRIPHMLLERLPPSTRGAAPAVGLFEMATGGGMLRVSTAVRPA
eukprot:366029-Chlamydomonas_euryale.AAC.26